MDRLPEIAVPALLVGGRYDECTPGHLADMHARIAGSELVTIEDASHLCFAEQPAEFNQVINRFFDRTEDGTRPGFTIRGRNADPMEKPVTARPGHARPCRFRVTSGWFKRRSLASRKCARSL
jgi:hypothetical protein